MSDLAAAAAAVGAPEELVQRSAEARAQANGTSVEEVLAAWTGGGSPTAAPAEPQTPEPTEAPDAAEEPAAAPTAEPAPVAETSPTPVEAAPAPAVAEAVTASDTIPVLEAETPDRPLLIVFGAAAVFVVLALLGWVFPSLPTQSDQVVSSQIDFSPDALDGRVLYQQLDCASCHTQMVRPVVADVDLGPVTLTDTNQVLGVRRVGPDLSYVGSRLDPDGIRAVVTGGGSHPAVSLADDDLAALMSYLTESQSDNVEIESDE